MAYNIYMDTHKKAKGFTILELVTAVTVMAVLVSYGLPQFQKSMEQSRVDLAAANLQSIWTAQRLYRAQHEAFADGISNLTDFLDNSFITSISDIKNPFAYSTALSGTGFDALAVRQNSGYWSGTLTITETGQLSGFTTSAVGTISPARF